MLNFMKNNKNQLITFFIFIFIISFVSFNYSVKAEEVKELNLKKAIELAYENNTELKKAERNKEKSELDLDLAWRALFPDLKLETSYTRMSEAPTTPSKYAFLPDPSAFSDEKKPVIPKPDTVDIDIPGTDQTMEVNEYTMIPTEQRELPKDNYQTSLSFTQPIYMGGRIRLGIEQAKRGLKMAEVQNEQKKSEILSQIINSYYNLIMAQERVEIEEQALSLVKKHKNIAESSYDSGVALKTDLLQAEIELSKAQNRLKNAKNQFELAKKSFKNQIGIDKSQKITIKDSSQLVPEINLDQETLYKKALSNKPELKMMELNQDLTKTNLKLEEKSNFPQIMLIGNYSWQGSELDFENGSGNIVLSASMNLFDSGKSNIKENKIEKELENIEDSKEDLKDMVELDIEKQLITIEEKRDDIKLQEMNLKKAEESLTIEEKRFKEGMGRTVDVVQAQTTLKQIKMSKMQAQNEYEIALFEMLNKTGDLVNYCEEVINNEE